MPNVNLQAFPELMPMLMRREREAAMVRSKRQIDPSQSDAFLHFWMQLAERVQEEGDLDNMGNIVRELTNDIDMLKSLKQSLDPMKADPSETLQLATLMKLIALLLDVEQKLKRWHWFLRDRALLFFLSINPAMPSKDMAQKDAEKDEKKKGQDKAKRTLDAEKKKAAPTKKMSA